MTSYPGRPAGAARSKRPLNPHVAYASLWEREATAGGTLAPTAVIFITNRECPFRCAMCDLWVNTLDETVPPDAVSRQVRGALAALPPATQVKLYNAGSFFDPAAIPPGDYPEIARVLGAAQRVIVEAHPGFLTGAYGDLCVRFRDLLSGRLEVAIGLETAHVPTLEALNKGMTLHTFRRAAAFLSERDIDLRVFVILGLGPASDVSESHRPVEEAAYPDGVAYWAARSVDEALAAGATACSVIPLRGDPGGIGQPPTLNALEQVVEHGLRRGHGRVFADLWDADRLFGCSCSAARLDRLQRMNQTQQLQPPVRCDRAH